MHYFTKNLAQRKQPAYKLISLILVITFIIYTTHNLIIFPNMLGEIWFDLFLLSGFIGFLGLMLLTDKFEYMAVVNLQEINLAHEVVDHNIAWSNMAHENIQIELICDGVNKVMIGARQSLQQQLFELLSERITPKLITAFIGNFKPLGLEQGGIKQVKSYLEHRHPADDLILVKKSIDRLQVKVRGQELVVAQKGLYKKIKPTQYDNAPLQKEEYFTLRQSYSIKKNSFGIVVKVNEKIVIKSMLRIAIKVPLLC